jgi:hypothetical protein
MKFDESMDESRAVLADQIVQSLDSAGPDAVRRLWAARALVWTGPV